MWPSSGWYKEEYNYKLQYVRTNAWNMECVTKGVAVVYIQEFGYNTFHLGGVDH